MLTIQTASAVVNDAKTSWVCTEESLQSRRSREASGTGVADLRFMKSEGYAISAVTARRGLVFIARYDEDNVSRWKKPLEHYRTFLFVYLYARGSAQCFFDSTIEQKLARH